MIIAGGIKIPFGKSMFPDHSLLLKLDPFSNNEFEYDRGAIKVEWYYEGDAELFTLICIKRHLDRCFSNPNVVLYMPYIPHARMDRVKSDEDVFTLKYFCEVINSLKFDIVHVRDAHSNVSLALLENVNDLGVYSYIKRSIALANADTLFFPDEGAMKRYSAESTLPYAFGMKNRDWKTGKILGLDIINADTIIDKNILIVDDICSRGGTFYHSAKALKEAGAKNVFLYVTHLEETVTVGDLPNSKLIDHIYTTKSIFPENRLEDFKNWITILE